MLLRPNRGFFGGLWVFPGGAVDAVDSSPLASRAVLVPDGVDDGAWRAAALRETVEEVGLALTTPALSQPVLSRGAGVFESVLASGARLDGESLRILSQWVTPVGAPSRFDARFYLTVVEGDPKLAPQPGEVMDVAWVTPQDALVRGETAEWSMMLPTLHHLRWLARFAGPAEAWEVSGQVVVTPIGPLIEADGSHIRVHLPVTADLP